MNKTRVIFIIIFFAVIAFVFIAKKIETHYIGVPEIPTDASVVEHFQKHQKGFEELKEMMKNETNIDYVSKDCLEKNISRKTAAELGFPQSRHEQYIKLIEECKIHSCLKRYPKEIAFLYTGYGYASHGWRISYIWREIPPDKIIKNINDFAETAKRDDYGYRPIEGNWYIWIIL